MKYKVFSEKSLASRQRAKLKHYYELRIANDEFVRFLQIIYAQNMQIVKCSCQLFLNIVKIVND